MKRVAITPMEMARVAFLSCSHRSNASTQKVLTHYFCFSRAYISSDRHSRGWSEVEDVVSRYSRFTKRLSSLCARTQLSRCYESSYLGGLSRNNNRRKNNEKKTKKKTKVKTGQQTYYTGDDDRIRESSFRKQTSQWTPFCYCNQKVDKGWEKAYLASHKKANSEGYGGSVVRQALVVYGSHRNVNRLRDPRRSSQVKDYKIGQCTTQNNEKK